MIGVRYAVSQIAATWDMAWDRPGWRNQMDRSVDGVFKSFWAIVFAAPLSFAAYASVRRVVLQSPDVRDTPVFTAPLTVGLATELADYLVNWGAALTALILFARAINASSRAAEIIIGFNWLNVLVKLIQLVPAILLSISGGSDFFSIVAIPAAVLIVLLIYGYIRRALAAPPAQSIAVLLFLGLLYLLLSLLIESGASAIIQTFS